jgi:predicted TIM-barrel fold metal-dependent hydrolase
MSGGIEASGVTNAALPAIVDTHHHLCDLSENYYPWLMDEPMWKRVLGDYSAIRRSYLIEDFLEDARPQNVVKSVHLQMGWDFRDPVGETQWLQGIADAHGFPHGIVGFARLEADDVEAVLDGHAAFANMRGIRQILNWDPDPVRSFVDRPDYMTDPKWLAGFALLRGRGMSFDLQLYPWQMMEAAALARQFPETQIVLNHAGMPIDRDRESLEVWLRGLRALARAPNVAVKISGLGVGNPDWTEDSIRPLVLATIETFGVGRCMVASNFPVDRLTGSYAATFEAFRAITADFSAAERAALFHDNAVRVYRL